MYKQLLIAAILVIPCSAFAGQAMPLEDGMAVASNSSVREIDTIGAPMQDADSVRETTPVARGVDEADARAQPDTTPRGPRSVRAPAQGSDASTIHQHRGHGNGKAPWQSLLPGVMK